MNYKLLSLFLFSTIIEFSFFWFIAGLVPEPFQQHQIFLTIVAVDIFVTELVFPGAFSWLYRAILNKGDE